jgi:ABC-type glycerol-3-phosphate transport system substrate-binding protein
MTKTRRDVMKLAAASAALPLVHIRGAQAAGKLSMVFWDHWVPAGNDAMRKLINEWSEKNKVEVQADFLTVNGGKINLTMAAEAQARTGHDAYAFDMWTVHQFADDLIPMDDVMQSLISANGPVAPAFEYLGKVKGRWAAVPTGSGSAPLTTCARISMLKKFAEIDVQALYPAREVTPPEAPDWTYETFLTAAQACHKGGYPFALGCGTTTDSVQTWGAIFGAMGAHLVDAKGKVTADTPQVRAALEYSKKLVAFLPPETVSYDDASNNRALISGKSALIWNPPSAWAVAKRDAPAVAADCWTFPNPKGPAGRMVPMRPYYWGVWNFSRNQSAAKELIHFLADRKQQETLCNAVIGYDIPAFESMSNFPIWGEVEPPLGTVYNYPIRPWHQAQYYITGSAGPAEIAVQMFSRGTIPTMVAKLVSGQSVDQAIAWAKEELEGYTR